MPRHRLLTRIDDEMVLSKASLKYWRSELLLIADDTNARMREQILHAARVVYSLREDIPANAWAKVFPEGKS